MSSAQALPLAVAGIDNVLFVVDDLDRARSFYGDRLGLGEELALPERGIALFTLGGGPGLLLREDPRAIPVLAPRPSPRIWLLVADARAAAVELEARGVPLLARPFELRTGWAVEVADHWGHVIGFVDETGMPGTDAEPL
jgi:catechol 2,3-dioxygenase-like lactoylglutathione lyase family enzyme